MSKTKTILLWVMIAGIAGYAYDVDRSMYDYHVYVSPEYAGTDPASTIGVAAMRPAAKHSCREWERESGSQEIGGGCETAGQSLL